LLHREEFLSAPAAFRWFDHASNERRLRLPPNSLAFTYCQTPVIYQPGRQDSLTVHFTDGLKRQCAGGCLDVESSRAVLCRTGQVARIVASFSRSGGGRRR
jgi:hypothetical protein